ncbi:hypothetical protein GWK47_035633 [Chionoecetes opilio]|uniref:Uncharacterized protein n=1 Tax=Chionoecetes opilio TaxID=41210 RepID=A0A8J4YN43_CHIOP|nr:hypothetical protein GWK47_035633 [Chionoecetes opilio]
MLTTGRRAKDTVGYIKCEREKLINRTHSKRVTALLYFPYTAVIMSPQLASDAGGAMNWEMKVRISDEWLEGERNGGSHLKVSVRNSLCPELCIASSIGARQPNDASCRKILPRSSSDLETASSFLDQGRFEGLSCDSSLTTDGACDFN